MPKDKNTKYGDRFDFDEIASPPGVGLDKYYITDKQRSVGLKAGIIAKTHSLECAQLIVRALDVLDDEGLLDLTEYEKSRYEANMKEHNPND